MGVLISRGLENLQDEVSREGGRNKQANKFGNCAAQH